MHVDGRRTNELRQVTITPDFVIYPEGSVLMQANIIPPKTLKTAVTAVREGVINWELFSIQKEILERKA